MDLGCEECGNLPFVEINGAAVEQAFEGITFRFYFNHRVEADPDDRFDSRDRQMSLRKVREYAMSGPMDTICPKCGKAAYVEP